MTLEANFCGNFRELRGVDFCDMKIEKGRKVKNNPEHTQKGSAVSKEYDCKKSDREDSIVIYIPTTKAFHAQQ